MLLNNNSLIMQWNRDENGNPMSWHIPLEVQQISPTHGVIQLVQVPDQHQRIKIVTEENIHLTEVFNIEDITLDSFYVDYGVGIVRFHESQHGKMVKVNYYGRGVILISDSRIFHRDGENVADTWDNILDRSKDALDLIESAGGLVGAMEKIDEKIEQGNATADRLENFITETQFYGYTITLSREAFVVKAKESGEVGKTEISTIYTDVIVYKGAKQITPVLSIEQEQGCAFKVDGQRVKLTSMDINVIKAVAVLNIDCGDGLVAQRKLEVTKVFDGVSQYSVEMTNPFYSFEANSTGAIEEEKTITCNITVTKANVDYTNYSISVQNAPRGLRYNIGTSSVDFTCTTGNSLPSSGSCLVVVTIDGTSFNKAFTWNKTRKGEDAKSLVLIGGQILRYETPDYSDIPTPHRSTVTAKIVGLSGTPKWYVRDNTTWNLLEGQVGTELTFMYNDATIWGNRKETTIKCELEGYEDELTLVKLATGGNGTDAIAVILTNESHTVAIDNSGQVHESEIAKATTQVLAYQGIEVVTPILSKGTCDGCDISIDGNMVRLHSLDNSFSTATAIINVNVNGTVIPKTWTISKAKQGTNGATGENGSSYILNVTEGTRSFTYSQINLDPRPSVSATFVGSLYENGTEVTEEVSYYWVARGHLQGSSVSKTFTPTIAKTFDESILNNDIQLTVTYKGNTVTQTIPISITKDANGLDWVQEWDDTKTEVRGNLILTPKIFAGSYDQENDLITGVAVGKDVLNDGNTIGVAGYQNNKTTFLLDTDGTLMVGNPFEQDSTGLYFDGENFTLKVNELSIEGSNVATTDDLTTQVDEAINSAKEEVKAEIEEVISQVNSLDSYMNNALKDGILDEVERNRLHTLYENITSEYLDTIAQYRSIAGNTHLTDEAMLAVLEGHFTTYLTCFEVLSDAFNTIMEAEVLTGEAVEAFKNAISDLRVASTNLLQSLTNALTCISEAQANEIVANAKLEIKQEVDDVSNALAGLENTMNGDFKSGLISTMNLTTLKSKLSQLETEKADIDGQYKGLVENPKLGATSRTNLANAKGELDTAHDQLVIKINTAIADLLMTEAELQEINRLITVYGEKLRAYSEVAQQANADIALNLAQGAIQALNQEDIFNKLTNNGETQGIYLQNGKVYINGEYINSRNFKAVRNDGTETFKIDSEGNVHIRANSFHLVGDSIDTNLADKDYVDSAIESVATGSVNVMLSNEAQVIATSNSRVPFSNQTFSAKVGVYMGSTEVKDFTIGAISSANGISVSVNQSTKTINFSVSTETTVTADNGSFTIPVSFNGNTYNKKWTWAVSKQGNAGATGSAGVSAKTADIITSSQVFKSTDGGLTFSPTTVKLTPKLQNVTYSNWQYSTNGGSSWTNVVSGEKGMSIDSSNKALTVSKDSSLFTSTVTSVTFRLNTNDSSVYDTMTIVKLYDVADLEIGGRNYLKGTTNGVTITGTNTSNQWATLGSLSVNCSELDGKVYVLTAKYKVTSSGTPSGTIQLQAGGDLWGGIQSNIATLSASNKSGVLKASGTLNLNGKTFNSVQVRCDNLNETIKIYDVKYELGNKPTDWSPAPEDLEDYADQSAQDAVNAQTQNSIFNKLTNNGQTQGIYLENSKIYINGEYIKTDTLSADKVLVGDYTNYCQLTEQTPMSDKFNKYTHSDGTIWHEMKTINRDTRISRDYSCKGGEKFRVTGYVYGKVTSTTSGAGSTTQENTKFRIGIFGKKTDGSNFWLYGDSGDGASTGSIVQVNKIITLPSDAKSFYVALQIEGYAPFSGVARCRNIEVRRMNTGELIVDGSITAKSLHADVLSANSIVSTINGGSTNISGNKIRTGTIQSNNGKSTINLDNGSMNLGTTSDSSYLQWTGSALNIKANSINIGSSSVATSTDVGNAKNEAINSANSNTANTLKGYYTKTQTDSAIKVAKDEINLGVSSTYETKTNVETKINGISVGGTNLAYDTNKGVTAWNWSIQTNGGKTITDHLADGIKGVKMVKDGTAGSGWNFVSYGRFKRDKITPATTYVVSFEIKSNLTFNVGSVNLMNGDSTGTLLKSITAVQNKVTANSKTWAKIVFKLVTLDTLPSSTAQVIYITGIPYSANATHYFRNLKLEVGNTATAWSPALEDTTADIATAKTEAINSANSTLTSTIGNYYTKSQTDSQIKVAKDAISQSVASTYETKTEATNKINGVNNSISSLTTRMSTAESKITDTAITNTVKKNFYTKEETNNQITSKGYQTASQVQQTVNNLQIKFAESGGYNLFLNSGFKKNMSYWGTHTHNSPTGGSIGITTSAGEWGFPDASVNCVHIRLSNQSGIEYGISQAVKTTIGKKYTISFYYAGHRLNNANLIVRNSNGSWLASKAITSFPSGGNSNANNWSKHTLTFTASATSHTVNIAITNAGSDGYMWIAKPQVVEGELDLPYSPNPSEVYDGIIQMDKDGIKVSTSNGGWTDFTSLGMNVYNKSSALSLGTRNGGLTYHGGGAYLGFTSESIVEAYNTRGVSISTATGGAYITLGHSSATDPFGGFSSTPCLSIAKQDIGDSSSFYRKGVNVHTTLNLNTQNINRMGTINFATDNTSKIYHSTANNLCMFGNNGAVLGYREGDSNVTKLEILEGSDKSTSDIHSYAHWRFHQWSLTDVGQIEVVSRLKMLGTGSIHFNANATHPSAMWHASGDGKLKIFGDNGVDIGYREGDTNRPIFQITEGENGAYRLQSFSHWHFNNWNLDYVGNVHAQRFTVAGTSGAYYITKGTGDGADYTTYGCLFYTHNGVAFTANGGAVTLVVQGRSGRIMGKNAYYVNSSKCLKSDIRAVTSESEPMPVNLKQGEVVDETLTMEMIGDFIDTIGIRTYITDFEQEGATQKDVDPQQGHVLNLGYIADDLAHHPVFKYIGEKTPDNLYAINSNSLTTVALAGLQAERKERRKLEQRLQRLEAMLLKGDEQGVKGGRVHTKFSQKATGSPTCCNDWLFRFLFRVSQL